MKGDTPIEERYEIIRKQKEAVFNQLEEVKLIKLRTFRFTTKAKHKKRTLLLTKESLLIEQLTEG